MTHQLDRNAIDALLSNAVATGAVPHVAAIVADADGVLYEGGFGVRTVGGDEGPITPDTTFRLMSMTKMIVTAAALSMRDEGLLDFAAPVSSYLPEFANQRVLTGFDGDEPVLVEPNTEATVHHLVTHTAGFSYWFWNEKIARYEQLTGTPNVVTGKQEALHAPLVHHPGEVLEYGINTDWLGRVMEAAAGQPLDEIVRSRITKPLGMANTGFEKSAAAEANSVTTHVRDENGKWMSVGDIVGPDPDWLAGGHGLFSTPNDYTRFERALLRGGELDGVRILAESTVNEAFQPQIGDLEFPAELPTTDPGASDTLRIGPGNTWGFGLLVNKHDSPIGRRAGSGAWSGLCNTHFFIDRESGLCASIYSNTLPFVESDGAWAMFQAFERAIYAKA
ncbi:serine hydrolase domain-containing protein [Leucobacter albus]|uniref:Serine hydrolase domain-containing protein n=1 Tax=Leucobacter albus TaxID=272210 RepID=A0ABW3TNW7_9MICO